MLRRIETVDNIPDFLEGVKNREEKLMGFGHRVYKNYDPRARIIKKHVDEVLEITGDNPLLDIATELEKRALDDEYFTDRKLYPNVDFYSGLIYEALGIPSDMFTVIFAIPRTSGWIAQWMEMLLDKEQKIARPRQIYTGRARPRLRRRSTTATGRRRSPARRPAGPSRHAAAPRQGRRNPPASPSGSTGSRYASAAGPDVGIFEWMGAYKLTIRHGPKVSRETHESLEEAVESMREHVGRIRRDGDLPDVRMFRTYEAGDRVNARLEISTGRMLRSRDAGIDVMGDGALVPFRGGIARRPLEPSDDGTAYDAVTEALSR